MESNGIVAVTGAAGHVGANLVRALVSRGRRVRALLHERTDGIDGLPVETARFDVLDGESCRRALSGADVVYHLAARISVGWEAPGPVSVVNVTGTRTIVGACRFCGVRRLVHFSSIHAFSATPADGLIDERRALAEDIPSTPAYDRSKAAGEREVLAGIARGLDAVIVNPTAILGPYDFGPSAMGKVLLDLFHGKIPALVAGAGFNWVDVRDVVDSAIEAERRGRTGERYLVSGQWLSLVDFARLWAKVSGARIPSLVVPMRLARIAAPLIARCSRFAGKRPLFTPDSLRALRNHRYISHERSRIELGHAPRPLEETLRDTYRWLRESDRL